jgi:gluconate:H+ symporter, GntP family
MTNFSAALSVLVAAIAFIVWGTARKNFNAFFVLLLAALSAGVLSGMPLDKLTDALKTGFGETMQKIGIVILLGTALGVVLEKTGATLSLANYILKKTGTHNAPSAIGATGFLVGLPIFCDSGFIILSGLNRSLARATAFGMPVMATVLATALYSVHCLVPPHPGISAAAVTVGADLGRVMLWGIVLAVPGAVLGYYWAKYFGGRAKHVESELKAADFSEAGDEASEKNDTDETPTVLPAPWKAILPILLPVALIGMKSLILLDVDKKLIEQRFDLQLVSFIGEPAIALLISIAISILLLARKSADVNQWLSQGIVKSGLVLAIIGAGGAFGNILKVTNIGGVMGQQLLTLNLGIWLPFILSLVLKTAQGSSTVAVITTASLITPMLPQLGLDHDWGRIAATLAMGAGSMAVSHGSDAYFWVITRFSDLEPKVMFRVYSTCTLAMAVVTQICLWGLMYLS